MSRQTIDGQRFCRLQKYSVTLTIIAELYLLHGFNSSDAGDGIFRLCGVNIMPGDALAPKVAIASSGMVLAV